MPATRSTRVLLASFLCFSCRVYGQRQPAPQLAVEIIECENSGCTPEGPGSPVWSFSGSMGFGRFGTGVQPLTIEHIDASSIAVRRVDTTGPATGLTALYMGRLDGQRITGSVIYYDPNHANWPRTGVWNGILKGSPTSLTSAVTGLAPRFPFTLRECESNRCLQSGTPYPIIWTFPSPNGQGWLGDKPRPMILEDLSPGFLLVRRFEPLFGLTAFYFGRINGKHITGSALYFDRDHPNQPRSDTWFGEIQNAFVPEEAMSAPAPTSPAAPPNGSIPPSDRANASAPVRDATTGAAGRSPSPIEMTSGYPPPPAGVPVGIGSRHKTINLNGDWEGYYASPAIPTAIRIRHDGTHIEAELLHDDLTGTGTMFFKGDFEPRASIARVQVLDMNGFSAFTGAPSGTYHTDAFGTVDFDHVAIQNHRPFQRISLPSYNDIPCSSANETAVKAEWAYMRAVVAQKANNMQDAVCWLYVASIQGDARAAFYLAYCVHNGVGTTANLPQAFQWAEISAQKGNEYGAYLVALLYERGDAVEQSAANARYWRQRGDEIKRQKKEQADAEKQREAHEIQEILPLAAMSVIGLALLADEVSGDHLCDRPPYAMNKNDYDQYMNEKRRRLDALGMECDGVTEVPKSRK